MAYRCSATFGSWQPVVSSVFGALAMTIVASLFAACSSDPKTAGCTVANCTLLEETCQRDVLGDGTDTCLGLFVHDHLLNQVGPVPGVTGCVQGCIATGEGEALDCMASRSDLDAGPDANHLYCTAAAAACLPSLETTSAQSSCSLACIQANQTCSSTCPTTSWTACLDCATPCRVAEFNCLKACPAQ